MKTTKLLLLYALLFCIVLPVRSQSIKTTAEAKYSYDAAGNRISRAISSVIALRSDVSKEDDFTPSMVFIETDAEVSVYPNPTEGAFTVDISNVPAETECEICIYDTQGRLMEKRNISHSRRVFFDISSYKSGIYFLRMTIGEKASTTKIMKK